MRWRWLRLRRPEQPIEPATWAPPGPIPDGDTIPVQRPGGGTYPLYVQMTHPGPEQHPLRQETVAMPVVKGPYLTLGAVWRGGGWR